MLYYSAVGTSKVSKSASCPDRTWKVAVRTEKERRRIIESCHSSPYGKYMVRVRVRVRNFLVIGNHSHVASFII